MDNKQILHAKRIPILVLSPLLLLLLLLLNRYQVDAENKKTFGQSDQRHYNLITVPILDHPVGWKRKLHLSLSHQPIEADGSKLNKMEGEWVRIKVRKRDDS